MKAAIFERPSLENLEIKQNIEVPKIKDHGVLIKVKKCGVNPIDEMVPSGTILVKPLPHIPGVRGKIEIIGDHVEEGDLKDPILIII